MQRAQEAAASAAAELTSIENMAPMAGAGQKRLGEECTEENVISKKNRVDSPTEATTDTEERTRAGAKLTNEVEAPDDGCAQSAAEDGRARQEEHVHLADKLQANDDHVQGEEKHARLARLADELKAADAERSQARADKAHSQETNAAKLMDETKAASDEHAKLAKEDDRIRQEERTRLAKIADELKAISDERARLEEERTQLAKLADDLKAADDDRVLATEKERVRMEEEGARLTKLADELRKANDERTRLEEEGARMVKLAEESKAANMEKERELTDDLKEANDERARIAAEKERLEIEEEQRTRLAKLEGDLKAADGERTRLEEERAQLAKLVEDLKAADLEEERRARSDDERDGSEGLKRQSGKKRGKAKPAKRIAYEDMDEEDRERVQGEISKEIQCKNMLTCTLVNGRQAIQNFMNDPIKNPLGFTLRKQIRENQELLPEAATRSRELALHCLLSNRDNVQCLIHWRAGATEEKDGISENSPFMLSGVSGYRNMVGAPKPGHMHCGCDVDVALMHFIFQKTWTMSGSGGAIVEGMRTQLWDTRTRGFVVEAFKRTTGLTLADLYSGTRDYDGPEHTQHLLRTQIARLLPRLLAQNELLGLNGLGPEDFVAMGLIPIPPPEGLVVPGNN